MATQGQKDYVKDAISYWTGLLLTPGQVRDEATAARLRQQQEAFLDMTRRHQQLAADQTFSNSRRESAITSQQGAAAFERDQIGRRNEVGNTIELETNRANLTGQLLGQATDSKVNVIGATYRGAGDLVKTQGGVEGQLQRDRLASAERMLGQAQAFETAQADRFVGSVPLAENYLSTAERMQGRELDARMQAVQMLAPTEFQRKIGGAIGALAPIALMAASFAR